MTFIIHLLCALASLGAFAASARAQTLDAGTPPDVDAGTLLDGLDAGGATAVLEADAGTLPDAAIARDEPTIDEPSLPVAPLLPTGPDGAIEVEVRTRSRADVLRRSSLAVGVVELREAKRGSADLGEVLARVEGVSVRRAGALGSDTRFALGGLEGEQIRFFLDGVPLELSGFPFGVANVPVNLLERVEIYRGVVPIRLGADALGGALELVTTTPKRGTHGAVSYQTGSFDTHRGTLDASHEQNGYFVRASAFADYAKNDYPVTVEAQDVMSRPVDARVHLFHNAYRAEGGSLTLGAVDKPWAKRLSLRTFFTDYRREIQNDVTMSQPYGDVTAGGLSTGSVLTYQHMPTERLSLDASAGYTFSITRLRDMSTCDYDWYGRCYPVLLASEQTGGALTDARLTQHAGFVRGNARYQLAPGHTLGLSLAPTYYRRGGDDRYEPRPGARDPLDVDRRLTNFVAGVEYGLAALSERLEATAFGKSYLQWVRSEELLKDGENSVRRDRSTQRLGAGVTARYAIVEPLWIKASYEYATRLPNVDEVFGNGILIEPNLQLAPEVSHNGNLSLAGDYTSARAGRFTGEATGFLRDADRLINLVGIQNTFRYQNVVRARALGGTLTASWASPRDLLTLGGNTTYQSFRNESDEGGDALFKGQRMPNRPYFFANGHVRGQLRGLFADNDTLSLTYLLRYTHAFYRGWERFGLRDSKDGIPNQLVHSLLLMHVVARSRSSSFATSLELQNLTNERVFDFFGVEKPGRAVFAKIVAEH